MRHNQIKLLVILFVLLLAFVLRFYKVSEIPPSLNWDEVSIGYNAYSILKTGKDEWGVSFPLHFKSYGEYKLPSQIYFSIPGIWIFGLNEFGVRITPVVYGTLSVFLLFLFSRKIFNKFEIGLLSAFLLAISPWHIHLTRASFESSFALFWVLLGIWLLIKGFYNKIYLCLSSIPLAVSFYTYNTARVFTPIFLFSNWLLYIKDFLRIKRYFFLSVVLFSLLLIPVAPFILSGEGSARYKLVSITDDPGLVPRINEARGKSNLPYPLPILVHNKVSYVIFYFLRNYSSHFTPDFLFLKGAPHKQHHVQGIGELYLFQAPFLLLGIYILIKRREKFRLLLFSWILLSFIPVSITNDSIPHALRTLIVAPALQIVTAYGIYEFFIRIKYKNKKLFLPVLFLLGVIIAASLLYYLYLYFDQYPKKYSRDWQYGYKQAVEYIKENKNKYDLIVFTRHFGEPHMFTLFFTKYDPIKFQKDQNLNRFETYDWIRVLNFDKFYFPDLGDKGTTYEDVIRNNKGKRILFIGKYGDFPKNKKLKTINFLNGDVAFEIVDNK